MTTQELEHQAQPAGELVHVSPMDLPAEQFRGGLERRKENRTALMEWVRESLVDGVDFGKIHVVKKAKCPRGKYCTNPAHFSKPCLFKPGAEKICGMLGVTVHFPALEGYEKAIMGGVQLQQIIIRCEIRGATGGVVADGVGARSLQQDYGDVNKSLKMAEKSAHIDATLRMAGLSEMFTQDLEDMVKSEGQQPGALQGAARPAPPDLRNGAPNNQPASAAPKREAASEELQRLEAKIQSLGLDRGRVASWVLRARNTTLENLHPDQYPGLIARMEAWAQERETEPPAQFRHEDPVRKAAILEATRRGWNGELDKMPELVDVMRKGTARARDQAKYLDRGYDAEIRKIQERERLADELERYHAEEEARAERTAIQGESQPAGPDEGDQVSAGHAVNT